MNQQQQNGQQPEPLGAYVHFTGNKSSSYILLLLKQNNCLARMEVF